MSNHADTPDPQNGHADPTTASEEDAPAGPEAQAGAQPDAGSQQETGADAPKPDAGPVSAEHLQAVVAALRDQLLRAVADADNTRKRADREIAETRVYAVANFARDLLSVNDNLARALDVLTPEMRDGMREAGRTLLDGIEMTQKEFHAVLARHAVEPISADGGEAFDPNVHQAVAQIPSPHPAGAIVEVMQSGWKIGDRVLRAAMVAVSSGAPAAAPGETAPNTESGSGDGGEAPRPGSSVDTQA